MSDPTNNADYVIEALCKEFPELLVAVEGQAEYEVSMRRLFNENHSNKPRALVRPKTVDEVCHVLKFASANQLQVSVLGGGHDPKGLAIIRDGLVLDMSAMKRIDIDLQTETAWVEAGVTVKDLDDVTCPQGLAAVNGSCTTVGIVGFTLGGGFGFLSRTQGLAVDNCLQMEMITTAGQRVVASPQEHEQLYWALRGAGQVGYGVVTKAQVKLHKLREKYVGGRFYYIPMNATKLRELLQVMNEFCRAAEDEITFNIYLITQIPGVAVDYFYDGAPGEAEKRLLPFLRTITEAFGPPAEGSSVIDGRWEEQTTSYLEYQQRFGEEPVKTQKMWKSAFLGELTTEIIQIIIHQLNTAPVSSNPHTIGLELLGGEINRKPRDSCAYVHRDALYLFSVQAVWKPEDEANGYAHACRHWAEETGQSLLAHSLGSYQNYADCGEQNKAQRLENYFNKSNVQKLKRLKEEYDPLGILTREHFSF